MVQFLPPTTKGRLTEESGKAFTSGIGEVLDEAREYKRNRGRLQDALKSIENISPEDRKNPTKLLTSLISATAGVPGAEKYVGSVFDTMMRQQQQKGLGNFPMESPGGGIGAPQGGQGQPTGQPQTMGGGQPPAQGKNAGVNVLQFEQPSGQFPGQIADPNLQNVVMPKTYTPEQIQNIRQRARAQGMFPEQEEALVNQATEYNNNARKQIADLQSGYALQQTLRNDTLANQQAFKEYIEGETPEFTSPDEKQLALEVGDKYQNEPSMAKRLAKVKAELRPYQQAKTALETTLKRPLFGMNDNQLQLARKNAQMMVDKGQKDQLRLMIASGGHGDVEEALLLNPLPSEVNKKMESIPKFATPEERITVSPESPKFEEQRQRAVEFREKQKASTERYIEDVISPGTYAKPGTNILLLRKNLMDKGMPWDEAGLMIQNAVGRKGIELDPHQQVDMQKLGYPPLGGDAYTDNLIQYYLFGKE